MWCGILRGRANTVTSDCLPFVLFPPFAWRGIFRSSELASLSLWWCSCHPACSKHCGPAPHRSFLPKWHHAGCNCSYTGLSISLTGRFPVFNLQTEWCRHFLPRYPQPTRKGVLFQQVLQVPKCLVYLESHESLELCLAGDPPSLLSHLKLFSPQEALEALSAWRQFFFSRSSMSFFSPREKSFNENSPLSYKWIKFYLLVCQLLFLTMCHFLIWFVK